jgi:hypothetical protein
VPTPGFTPNTRPLLVRSGSERTLGSSTCTGATASRHAHLRYLFIPNTEIEGHRRIEAPIEIGKEWERTRPAASNGSGSFRGNARHFQRLRIFEQAQQGTSHSPACIRSDGTVCSNWSALTFAAMRDSIDFRLITTSVISASQTSS